MTPTPSSSRSLVYFLLITVAVSAVAGRILSATFVLEPRLHRGSADDRGRIWPATRPAPLPIFGSNDRSRWATVRALVDEGTYVIGRRDRSLVLATAVAPLGGTQPLEAAVLVQAAYVYRAKRADHGIIFEDGWQSVDKVLHPATLEFYSSKPPLLSTLVAGLYWLLQNLLGWTFARHTTEVVRTILLLLNGLTFWVYLRLLARLVERYGRTDWGRYYVLAAAGFATLLSLFAITFNNHSVGTFCAAVALYGTVRIWEVRNSAGGLPLGGQNPHAGWFALVGFFAALAVCNELPSAALAAALFVVLLCWYPRRTLLIGVPAALLPLAAFFLTNYLALGQLRPAYAELKSPWYQYEGSHWREPMPGEVKRGIDWAKESRPIYAFHCLLGHHGLFSLTPIWLLAMVGMLWGCLSRRTPETAIEPDPRASPVGSAQFPLFLYPLSFLVTVVVVGFYLVKTDNYGGNSNGLRWLMWLTPLWLMCLLPIADRLAARRWGRGLGYLFLGWSVLSVNYQSWNPWRHPWLYDLFVALGWPGY